MKRSSKITCIKLTAEFKSANNLKGQIPAPSKPHPNQAHNQDQNSNGSDFVRKIIMCKETEFK